MLRENDILAFPVWALVYLPDPPDPGENPIKLFKIFLLKLIRRPQTQHSGGFERCSFDTLRCGRVSDSVRSVINGKGGLLLRNPIFGFRPANFALIFNETSLNSYLNKY